MPGPFKRPCRCSHPLPAGAVSLSCCKATARSACQGPPCHAAAAPSIGAVRVTAAAPCAQVRAAPDAPLDIERQYRRMEWILYRLRRAHAQGGPAGPAAALASMGACQGSGPNFLAMGQGALTCGQRACRPGGGGCRVRGRRGGVRGRRALVRLCMRARARPPPVAGPLSHEGLHDCMCCKSALRSRRACAQLALLLRYESASLRIPVNALEGEQGPGEVVVREVERGARCAGSAGAARGSIRAGR
jgi:hypothetical protein